MIPGQRRIIAIINKDLIHHPSIQHLKSPVTIEHTLIKCPRCSDDCWIGPTQLGLVTFGAGELLCYKCMFQDPELQGQAEIPMVSVNPDIEDVPRRIT